MKILHEYKKEHSAEHAFAEALATVLLLQASAMKQPNRKDKNKAYVTRKNKNDKN